MKVILFGATGMVGQGVLLECLADTEVTSVLVVGRTSIHKTDPKIREILHPNFEDFSTLVKELTGYDACFFCMGVSSAGMPEAKYHHLTYDFALAAAKVLAKVNPGMTFIYVSGMGTDSTEKGSVMWARVKGKTENDLMKLAFKKTYMFRPAAIQPYDGVQPKNKWLKVLLVLLGPLFPIFKWLFPKYVTTTRRVGKAMIRVVRREEPKPWIENWDINRIGGPE